VHYHTIRFYKKTIIVTASLYWNISKNNYCCLVYENYGRGNETITCSKCEWDTKKGPGKSMKNALYVQWAPLGLKQRRTAKKINPVPLAIVEFGYDLNASVSSLLFVQLQINSNWLTCISKTTHLKLCKKCLKMCE